MTLLDSPSPPVTNKLTPPRRSNGQSPPEAKIILVVAVVEPVAPDPPPPLVRQDSRTLTAEVLRSIWLRNNKVRPLIYKEVKRPGKRHDKLWEMITQLHGPPWLRKQFILEVPTGGPEVCSLELRKVL